MRVVWLWLVCLLAPSAVSAQHLLHGASGLAHGIPDLCASGYQIAAGTSETLTGPVSIPCIGVHGTLNLDNADLTTGTLLVYADGTLIVSGKSVVSFAGQLDTTADPEQFGIGLVVLGRLRVNGEPRVPFVRLTGDVPLGAVTLTLEKEPCPAWRVGDTIIIPDTRQVADTEAGKQTETRQIAAVSGPTLTLSAPLTYAHKGAHDPDGTLKFAPHVANLTRPIVFRSADPNGVRGHVVLVNRADIDIRYASFEDLGRTKWEVPLNNTTFSSTGTVTHVGTNQIGKYALHAHHLFGPANLPADVPQFSILGNVIKNSSKWGITLHNAHFGLVRDNVIVNAGGAGIMTEDGSETGNTIDHNFVVNTPGTGQRGDARGNKEFGFEGTAIWLRGPRNRLTRNVAAANTKFGVSYFSTYLGNVRVPNFKGADPSVDGTVVDGNNQAILEDTDNEIYASDMGLEYWWLGCFGKADPRPNAPIQLFSRTAIWHTYHKAVFNYPAVNVILDGFVIRGDATATTGTGYGIEGGDYLADGWIIRNFDIRGLRGPAIKPSQWANTEQRIENGVIQSKVGIYMDGLPTSAYTPNGIPPRRVLVSGVTFLPIAGALNVKMQFFPGPVRTLVQKDELILDGKHVFYKEQAPNYIVPQTILNPDGTARLDAAPVAGLTNQQLWDQYGKAIAGAVASCTTTVPGIQGFVCN